MTMGKIEKSLNSSKIVTKRAISSNYKSCFPVLEKNNYFLTPPLISDDFNISDEVKNYVFDSHNEKERQADAVYAYNYENCYVLDSGLLVTDKNELVAESKFGVPQEIISGLSLSEKIEISDLEDSGPLILISKIGYRNYGHWLVEMLPKVYLSESFYFKEARYAILDLDGPMKDVILKTLTFLNVPKERVLFFQTPIKFSNLVYMSPVTYHPKNAHPFISEFFRNLKARVLTRKRDNLQSTDKSRIFVSRGIGSNRQLENENEIFSFLEQYGFIKVSPGLMSFEEQVNIFDKSSLVVGIAGAAMTNMIFCKTNTPVLMIVPSSMPNVFFHNLANLFSLKYGECRGNLNKGTMYNDFSVDIDRFASFFENFMREVL